MPYIRVYLPQASIEQKRSIAENLIEITLRTFQLHKKDRYRISVEFVSMLRSSAAASFAISDPDCDAYTVEVMGHDLTERKKTAFSREAAATLAQFCSLTPTNPIARLLGIKLQSPPRITFRFGELNPATSEPFVVHPRPRAA
jgi:phenylpyruvate tautomerase PptA (4-oxalocrotonate tautomerase family)